MHESSHDSPLHASYTGSDWYMEVPLQGPRKVHKTHLFLCSLIFPPEGVTINMGNLSETGQQCFQYVQYSVEWWQNLLEEYSLLVG